MTRFLIASAVALVLTTAARADMIAGWDVSPKPDPDGICSIQHNYIDKDDENAANTVVITFGKEKDGSPVMAIVFGYSRWEYTKGEAATADLLVGDTVVFAAAKWQAASKTVLAGRFLGSDSILQPIASGSTLSLRFDGDKSSVAAFETPNIGQAIGAVQICRGQIK